MILIKEPASVTRITSPDIRALVQQRFAQLCDGSSCTCDDPYDADMLGYMVVVEAGDSVAALEKECGCPILHNLFEPEIRFGNPDFVPSHELAEDHDCCFELTYILGGDFGISLFVPKQEGINSELLAMCAQYAVPAPDLTPA